LCKIDEECLRLHSKYLKNGGEFRDVATAAGIYQVSAKN
jgi:hypothetical protein